MPNKNNLHQMGVVNTNRTIKIFCSECEFSTIAAQKSDEEVLHEHEIFRERESSFEAGKKWAQENLITSPITGARMSLEERTDLQAALNRGVVAAFQESNISVDIMFDGLNSVTMISWGML